MVIPNAVVPDHVMDERREIRRELVI